MQARLRRPQRAVAEPDERGAAVTVGAPADRPPLLRAMRTVVAGLLRIGYRARLVLRRLDDPTPASYATVFAGNPPVFRAGWTHWIADLPDPSEFFAPLFTCASARGQVPFAGNAGGFCAPRIDRMIRDAQALPASDPTTAAAWVRIDRAVTDSAAWVPFASRRSATVVAPRVGNYAMNPVDGLLLDQMWVR